MMCLLVCFRSVKVLLSSSLPHPVSGCFLGAAAVPEAVLLALQRARGTAVPAASSAGVGGGAVAP